MVVVFLSVFAFAFFGLAGTAHAWGTGAHVDFAMQMIANAAMLAPAVRVLLKKFPKDFLYGNLAADTVIGKNLADADEHVHNWEVAIKLFELSSHDSSRAFVYGYLSHLAADTVAHNYFVPKKRVDSFRSITSGHAYWELRYDSFLPAQVWDASRQISKEKFPSHDELLRSGIKPTILNLRANKLVWDGVVTVTSRVERWRDMMQTHAARSATSFDGDERSEFRTLALGAVAGFLNDFRESSAYKADPTGIENLANCWKIGALLRKQTSAGRMDVREADDIAKGVGSALREGLHVHRTVDLSAALRAAA